MQFITSSSHNMKTIHKHPITVRRLKTWAHAKSREINKRLICFTELQMWTVLVQRPRNILSVSNMYGPEATITKQGHDNHPARREVI